MNLGKLLSVIKKIGLFKLELNLPPIYAIHEYENLNERSETKYNFFFYIYKKSGQTCNGSLDIKYISIKCFIRWIFK